MNQAERRRFLIEKLLQERPSCRKQEIPQDVKRQKVLLRALMNVRAPKEERTAMRIALASTLHYREGRRFERFCYHGKRFATALRGDLWADGRPEEMYAIGADIVLWPVWCDYPPDDWNSRVKYEYARQAARCGTSVLFVNPFSADADTAPDAATGGSAYFQDGQIRMESPAGNPGILVVELGDKA